MWFAAAYPRASNMGRPGPLSRCLLLLAAVACVVRGAAANTPISLTFEQQISHDPHVPSPGTFKQRYFLSGPVKDMRPGSPIILYIGAEEVTGSWSVQEGIFEPTTWALQAGGLVVSVEHRYFGESLPFGNESYTNAHLKYLTVANDLADCITILNHVQEQTMGTHPVMAFGGSYGGLLSAAIRLHYPDVINASLASAGPVYLFGEVANSTWFDEVSETLLDTKVSQPPSSLQHTRSQSQHGSWAGGYDPTTCGSAVSKEFANLWAGYQEPATWERMQSRFGLCDPVTSVSEMYQLLYWAKEAFSEVVQFSYPRAQPPCDVGNAIDVLCSWNVTDLIATATNMIYNFTQPWGQPVPCFTAFTPSTSASEAGTRATAPASVAPRHAGPGLLALANAAAARGGGAGDVHSIAAHARRLGNLPIQTVPWDYLCCTEIVQPIAGRGIFSVPAPYDLNLISAQCKERYGVTPDPEWHRTFVLEPLSNATNIVFSNGGYDPVRGFSPATNLASTLIAIDIADMAHTFDLFATQAGDPENVVKAREQEWKVLSSMMYGPTVSAV